MAIIRGIDNAKEFARLYRSSAHPFFVKVEEVSRTNVTFLELAVFKGHHDHYECMPKCDIVDELHDVRPILDITSAHCENVHKAWHLRRRLDLCTNLSLRLHVKNDFVRMLEPSQNTQFSVPNKWHWNQMALKPWNMQV